MISAYTIEESKLLKNQEVYEIEIELESFTGYQNIQQNSGY